ncbi:MAG TPA: thiamine diphosphokinase [Firmicutes bacterium]|mgnify:CR=1 FL=1|jgi:thiamine pyrophosphokinase|nr:thiamine diphosphokinase [Bacillota bacterium]
MFTKHVKLRNKDTLNNKKNRICYIVGAGENYGLDFTPSSEDCVIAADGGLTYIEQADLTADLVIGDFDTLRRQPEHPHVITLSTEKDDTDTFAAVRAGINMGCCIFHIYCGTGGRLEHTVANIQLLAYLAEKKMRGYLFDQSRIITAITNASLKFQPHPAGYISVFSHSESATGVCLKGLKYELDNATLTNTFPIGISNEFIGEESEITVGSGTLLVMFPRERKLWPYTIL